MNQPARFFIFTLPRTGGTLLKHLLHCHPAVHCDYELFNPNRRLEAARAHLERCLQPHETLAYGFKFQLRDVRDEGDLFSHKFVADLMQAGWQMIYLRRRNMVRQALSLLAALERDLWHSSGSEPQPHVLIDCEQLLEAIRQLEVWQVLHNQVAARYPHLALVYEDDLLMQEAHQTTANRCFAYLGLPPMPVHSSLARTSTDRMHDLVENYEEVVATVSQTKYEKYLS